MKNRIRSAEISDVPAVRDIYAPFVLEHATSFETELPDLLTMERRILETQEKYPWLVFDAGGEVLGYAYASSHRARKAYQWSVEVSVYIHERARHRGIGRALYEALFVLLRWQGYANAYGGITLPNPASVGLHQALGFASIGVFPQIGFKFGKWHDVAWLHLRLAEPSVPPPEPRQPKKAFDDPGVVALLEEYALKVKLR